MGRAFTKIGGIGVYLAFVAGLAGVCLQLSHHVGRQSAALAAAHLALSGERAPSRVELRLAAVQADPVDVEPQVTQTPVVLDVPALPLPELVAQMDAAESIVGSRQPALQKTSRGVSRAQQTRRARTAAADVFGRSFGVMLVASR